MRNLHPSQHPATETPPHIKSPLPFPSPLSLLSQTLPENLKYSLYLNTIKSRNISTFTFWFQTGHKPLMSSSPTYQK